MGYQVLVVGGPAGTGKTTIAELLSQHLKCLFIEGDQLHPQANIDKMSRGEPLTDDDRWDWLKTLSVEASTKAVNDPSKLSVVSCSMLKKAYRDHIKQSATHGHENDEITFRFIFLYTTFEELLKRVGQRQNHYMKSDMVKSQYDIMEVPQGAELYANGGEALPVDTTDKSPDAIYEEIVKSLHL